MTAGGPEQALNAEMIRQLEAQGWTVLRTKSHLDAQRRHAVAQRRHAVAKSLLSAAMDTVKVHRHWADAAFAEQRRLADRLTHVYGVARAHGATVEELNQP